MYHTELTEQDLANFFADMADLATAETAPTDEEMDEMAKYFGEN
jgi:hypothetical protein